MTTKADEEKGYVQDTWNGLPHFQCLNCPYDSLEEPDMQAHVESHRVNPEATPRRYIPAQIDRFNNVVMPARNEDLLAPPEPAAEPAAEETTSTKKKASSSEGS